MGLSLRKVAPRAMLGGPFLCRPLALVVATLDDHRFVVMAPAMVAMPGMMPVAVHVIAVLDDDCFGTGD